MASAGFYEETGPNLERGVSNGPAPNLAAVPLWCLAEATRAHTTAMHAGLLVRTVVLIGAQ